MAARPSGQRQNMEEMYGEEVPPIPHVSPLQIELTALCKKATPPCVKARHRRHLAGVVSHGFINLLTCF